jgi:uncharacterized protein (DUF885 family)
VQCWQHFAIKIRRTRVCCVDRVNEVADRYVDEWASLDPNGATYAGIAGHDDRMTDVSPGGYAALAELDRRTLARLGAVEPVDERERVAKEAMRERLSRTLTLYDAGDVTSEVNVIVGGLHYVRGVFDLMPVEGEAAAANIAARMAAVPAALAQWRRTLTHAADQGYVSPRQQMFEVAKQCEVWTDTGGDNFYAALAQRAGGGTRLSEALRADLERAAKRAKEATAETGRFLKDELGPRGRAKQAAGPERYDRAIRHFLGAEIDVMEAYAWGFEELARLEAEMREVAGKIVPGGSVDDAVAALDADPTRNIHGKEAFRAWMQELADRAVHELGGEHFDIPKPVRRIECQLAPTSDGGIYYTGPSEDFSRPGQMWWAVPQGIDTFSTWREVTTVYHEGVPGHHLQVGQTAARAELLNRWQRLLCWCSGHGEGWALYAERLMDELGYLADPGDRLGMLDGQALRAARVIVDIGMHLELKVPRGNPFGFRPGERWTPRLGWEFMRAHCRVPDENLRFELNRYLGWPGQAPSYKIGERIWLRARADAQARKGADFDLRAFHRDALNLGSIGLDPLKAALARM